MTAQIPGNQYSKGAKKRARKLRAITLPGGESAKARQAEMARGGSSVATQVEATSWDRGASGAANQIGLVDEPATEIDPETGKETPNPNRVRRRRREDWVVRYTLAGHITDIQAANAVKLRMASEGLRERNPLAALGEVRGGVSDREAIRIDARRYFRQLWGAIPTASRPVVERVVINDEPIWRGNQASRERHFKRLAAGLDAISEGARK